MGVCIGYGVIWRFPYVMFTNGGGVFFIPYLTCIFLLAIPGTYLEVSVGQYFREPVLDVYKKVSKKWQGLVILAMAIIFFYSVYLIMIIVYAALYLIACFSPKLPWTDERYYTFTDNKDLLFRTRDYFYREILDCVETKGEIGGVNYKILLTFILSWIVVYYCLRNGIKNTGKIAYYTVISPYIFLGLLFIRVLFLEGSLYGMWYLLNPDFSQLFTIKIWKEGMTMGLYQTCIGTSLTLS